MYLSIIGAVWSVSSLFAPMPLLLEQEGSDIVNPDDPLRGWSINIYCNNPKFLDRQVKICTVCCSVCMVWIFNTMVEPLSLNFSVFTSTIVGVQMFMVYFAQNRGLLLTFGKTQKNTGNKHA